MRFLPPAGADAPGVPLRPGAPAPFSTGSEFSRSVPFIAAEAALAILAYATNQVVAGHVAWAHRWGELAHAQSRELAVAGTRALPPGVLRDALTTIASVEAGFADSVTAAANRYGRRFVHLAFAFPAPSRSAR